MTHRNSIIDADGVELERHRPRRADGFFDNLAKFLQMDVTRHDIDIRIDNCHERLAEVFVLQPGSAQQGAVRGLIETFFDGI